MSFVITHSGGTANVASYTVPKHTQRLSMTATREAGDVIRVIGDRMPLPADLRVELWVPAASYAVAFDAAFDVVDAARDATVVECHLGAFPVAALESFEVRAEANGASVRLAFLLAGVTLPGAVTYDATGASAATASEEGAAEVPGSVEGVTFGVESVTFGAEDVEFTGGGS